MKEISSGKMDTNRGRFYPPKWMVVKIMVPNPIKMDDLGGFPPIFGSTPTSMDTNGFGKNDLKDLLILRVDTVG